MSEKNLKANLDFVNKNKDTLLNEYMDKFIVVFNKKVFGSYDTYEAAAQDAIIKLGADRNFLVHHLTKEEPINFVISALL